MEISLPVLKIDINNEDSSYISFLSTKDLIPLLMYQTESFKELKHSKELKITKTLPEYFHNLSTPIINLLSEGKHIFSDDTTEESIGKLNISLSNKLYFVEYEQLLHLKKNNEIREEQKIILVITPVNDLESYKNPGAENASVKDEFFDLINSNISVCNFDLLVEKERTSISSKSLKLLTLNTIKAVNERLILNARDNDEKKSLVISFWKVLFEKFEFIANSKAYEVRDKYIITSSVVLFTLAEVIVNTNLNNVSTYQERLDALKEINWDKKNNTWAKINLIDNEGNIQPDSKNELQTYLTDFFKKKFKLTQKIYSSEEIYMKLREIIKTEYSTKWYINDRADGNASLSKIGDKVFLYFTHELGGVTINARIYPTNPDIQEYLDIWQTSRRINKVGRWGDEIIDIRLNNYSDIDRYLELINIISEK